MPSGGQQGDKLSFGKIGITAYGTCGEQGTSLWQAVFYLRYQRVVMRPAASNNQRRWWTGQSGQAVANHLGGKRRYRCDLIGCWQAGKIRGAQIVMKSGPV